MFTFNKRIQAEIKENSIIEALIIDENIDDKGRVTKRNTSTVSFKMMISANNETVLKMVNKHESQSKLMIAEDYWYDTSDRLTEEVRVEYNDDGSIKSSVSTEYFYPKDEPKRIVSKFNRGHLVSRTYYAYGRIERMELSENDKISRIFDINYDIYSDLSAILMDNRICVTFDKSRFNGEVTMTHKVSVDESYVYSFSVRSSEKLSMTYPDGTIKTLDESDDIFKPLMKYASATNVCIEGIINLLLNKGE